MKLFQQMLVAGAAMSLVAPLAAQASDSMNLDGMKSYGSSEKSSSRFDDKTFVNEVNEELATLKGRIDGLEAQQNDFEAGSFSDTTTMDGKAIFTLGAARIDEGNTHTQETKSNEEDVNFVYSYTLNLNSSFTGDDNLYVRIKTGNFDNSIFANKTFGTYLSSAKDNADALKVDKIWYQFPVGDNNTVWVGPKIENYYMHGTTPSIYQPVTKQFALGGNGEAYGASTDTGAGWAYKADNGFAVSSNIGTKSTTTTTGVNSGILTDETKSSWATQVGYTQDNYSASLIYNIKTNGWSDTYYHTANHGGTAKANAGLGNFNSIGLRGWWRPDETGTFVPSVSVGYDTTDYENATDATDTSDSYFVGLNWEDMFLADDKIGVAFGQPTKGEDETADPFAYEVYYSFKPNDSVTVTPAIFGGSDRNGTKNDDVVGYVLETTFKF